MSRLRLFRVLRNRLAARRPAADSVAARAGSSLIEPLEGRRLMAAQITGLELWTAGKTVDTKQATIPGLSTTATYDVAASGHTDKLDLLVKTSGATASTKIQFEVYSPIFKADASTRISQGTEASPAYVLGGNKGNDFGGRLRGPQFGATKQGPLYSLLNFAGAESKRFVVRVKIGGQAKFTEFVFTLTRGGAPTLPAVSSVKLLDAAGKPLFGDGSVKLDGTSVFNGLLNKKFTLVVTGTNLGSVKLDLRPDGVTGFQSENFKPFSLYGETASGAYVVKSVSTTGLRTLYLDLFSGKKFKGAEVRDQVTFRINS